jgi:Flp pilus assembly pilin Flp
MMQRFLEDESGQDMVEYVLLLAFIALVAAGMMIGMGSSTSALWSITNSRLGSANN